MSWIDGVRPNPEDAVRERLERDAMPERKRAEEAARNARAAAQAKAEADRTEQEMQRLEQQMRASYPGTDAMWEQEKGGILATERARLTAEANQQARRAMAANYQ